MYENTCPKQFKCVYNPWSKEPNIDDVVDSLNSIKKQKGSTCQEVQKDGARLAVVDATVMHLHALSVQMTYVINVIARMTIFKHENFILDLNAAHKSILYKDNKLLFMGDGYKAIQILISQSSDAEPVKLKFKAQLQMREKPKFNDPKEEIERLRKQVQASIVKTHEKKKKR